MVEKQRADALIEANRIRTYRKHVKWDLKAGRKALTDLLDDPDCATMELFDALRAMPKLGRVKAMKVLTAMRVPVRKTLGTLTERQRELLLEALAGRT